MQGWNHTDQSLTVPDTEAFFPPSLPQQTSPVSLTRSRAAAAPPHELWTRGLFLLPAMFPLLPKGSKLQCEKSCLLIKFAVCGGEALCLYNGHDQGAENLFLNVSGWTAAAVTLRAFPSAKVGLRGGFLHSCLIETSQARVFCGSFSFRWPVYPRTRWP